jgi:hypothetical protein
MTIQDRDFIGDIHGQVDKLTALLRQLGYKERQGIWRHPLRKPYFVGDYIDRGPGQLQTLRLVRGMMEADAADGALGNHEFNGIAFHMLDGKFPGQHLRVRTPKNRLQHLAFLNEVGEDSAEHRSWIEWFMTLPLWEEREGFRVVHACWHPQSMAALKPLLGPRNTLTPALVEAASRKGSVAYESVENLCKGLEVALPNGLSYTDAEGMHRQRTRVRWWDETATTYRQAAIVPRAIAPQLPDLPLPPDARVHYDQAKPLFFGHYWLRGAPQVLGPKLCCVDYSAAKDQEPLVAYRWEGEQVLRTENLVSSDPGWSPTALRRPLRHP